MDCSSSSMEKPATSSTPSSSDISPPSADLTATTTKPPEGENKRTDSSAADKVHHHHHHYFYHHHLYHEGETAGDSSAKASSSSSSEETKSGTAPTEESTAEPPSPSSFVTIPPAPVVQGVATISSPRDTEPPTKLLIISSMGRNLSRSAISPFMNRLHTLSPTLFQPPSSTFLNPPAPAPPAQQIPLITNTSSTPPDTPPVTPPTPNFNFSHPSQQMRTATGMAQLPPPPNTSAVNSNSTTSSSSSRQLLEALRNAATLVRTISNGSTFGPINPPPLNEEGIAVGNQNWPPIAALTAAAAAASAASSASSSTQTTASTRQTPSAVRPQLAISTPTSAPSQPIRPVASTSTQTPMEVEEVLNVVEGEASDDEQDDPNDERNRIVVVQGRFCRATIYPESQTANRSSLRARQAAARAQASNSSSSAATNSSSSNSTANSTAPQPSSSNASSTPGSSNNPAHRPMASSTHSAPRSSERPSELVTPNSSLANNTTTTTTTTIQPFPVQPTLLYPYDLPLVFGERYILVSQMEASNLYRCIDKESKKEFCCKVLLSKSYNDFLAPHFRMDGHPGVNQVVKIVVGRNHTFILFEQAFGDLHSYVRSKRRIREPEAAALFQQVVTIVADCHANGIILRDLKLRKFIFSNREKTKLRLECLEGAALCEDGDDTLTDKHGCPAYVSPEILNCDSYSGMVADCWSLGVILYTMLTGRYPFHDASPSVVFSKIRRGTFHMPDFLSRPVKCLIRSLIKPEPEVRLTSADALAHRWFSIAKAAIATKQSTASTSNSADGPSSPPSPGPGSLIFSGPVYSEGRSNSSYYPAPPPASAPAPAAPAAPAPAPSSSATNGSGVNQLSVAQQLQLQRPHLYQSLLQVYQQHMNSLNGGNSVPVVQSQPLPAQLQTPPSSTVSVTAPTAAQAAQFPPLSQALDGNQSLPGMPLLPSISRFNAARGGDGRPTMVSGVSTPPGTPSAQYPAAAAASSNSSSNSSNSDNYGLNMPTRVMTRGPVLGPRIGPNHPPSTSTSSSPSSPSNANPNANPNPSHPPSIAPSNASTPSSPAVTPHYHVVYPQAGGHPFHHTHSHHQLHLPQAQSQQQQQQVQQQPQQSQQTQQVQQQFLHHNVVPLHPSQVWPLLQQQQQMLQNQQNQQNQNQNQNPQWRLRLPALSQSQAAAPMNSAQLAQLSSLPLRSVPYHSHDPFAHCTINCFHDLPPPADQIVPDLSLHGNGSGGNGAGGNGAGYGDGSSDTFFEQVCGSLLPGSGSATSAFTDSTSAMII